jgi:hypothetical protein
MPLFRNGAYAPEQRRQRQESAMRVPFVTVSIPVLLLLARVSSGGDAKPAKLERYPVCEASAALEVPCFDDAQPRCIWVGDNEQETKIFQYIADAHGNLVPALRFELDLDDVKVGDVEALVADDSGVLIVGSHSRKSNCMKDAKRAAIARIVRTTHGALQSTTVFREDAFADRIKRCDSALINLDETQLGSEAEELRREFCAAVLATENAAEAAVGEKDKCTGNGFNIEGAITARDEKGRARVWLGLRGPTMGNRAVLLSLAPSNGGDPLLSFDGIAAIDLKGSGIRELAASEGWIWGLAGCVTDCTDPSRLWRIPVAALHNGADISAPEFIVNGDFLPGAEGLVIQPTARRAIVLIDGDTGKVDGHCTTPALQFTLSLL